MTKTKRYMALFLVAMSLLSVSVASAKSKSKAYVQREKQLLHFEGFYKNKDGTVGGEFELVSGKRVRVAKIDKDGNVIVYPVTQTYKKHRDYYIMSSNAIDSYYNRVRNGSENDNFN